MRRAALALPAALAALALSGCETTAQKSAKLQRQAKRVTLDEKGLSIARESTVVRALDTSVVKGPEGAAAVVTVSNRSARALQAVPIAITVQDAHGRKLFANDAPGLETALVAIPSLAAHQKLSWVDDQIPATGGPATVSARVGVSPAVKGPMPRITVSAVRLTEDPASGPIATGTVTNHSAVAQRKLVVFGLARRGGHVVAAGRGLLPELSAGASSEFQVYLVGDANGARLEVSAPPTTFG